MAGQCSGGMLVTTAAIIALQVSQGRSADELSLLAAFFTVLGDNLALIAGQLPQGNPIPTGEVSPASSPIAGSANA